MKHTNLNKFELQAGIYKITKLFLCRLCKLTEFLEYRIEYKKEFKIEYRIEYRIYNCQIQILLIIF